MLIFNQKRSTGVANADFLMKINNFGPKSDAQASNMLILDQKALDRSMLMLLGCFKYVVKFLIVFCISVPVFRT